MPNFRKFDFRARKPQNWQHWKVLTGQPKPHFGFRISDPKLVEISQKPNRGIFEKNFVDQCNHDEMVIWTISFNLLTNSKKIQIKIKN